MFDNSKIDHTNIPSQPAQFDYDTTTLGSEGYKCMYILDRKNPIFEEVISECKNQNVSYKIVKRNENQDDIWIKK